MEIRYYHDPETGEPHIYNHDVTEDEVEEVLRRAGDDLPGSNKSRVKLGQTVHGRYLKVIYSRDESEGSIFVITAYELRGKAKTAFRRRQRRKPKMSQQRFPPGWDEKRVRDVLAHYEGQTEDEEFAEIEAALESSDTTMVAVPNELVPQVQELISKGLKG